MGAIRRAFTQMVRYHLVEYHQYQSAIQSFLPSRLLLELLDLLLEGSGGLGIRKLEVESHGPEDVSGKVLRAPEQSGIRSFLELKFAHGRNAMVRDDLPGAALPS